MYVMVYFSHIYSRSVSSTPQVCVYSALWLLLIELKCEAEMASREL